MRLPFIVAGDIHAQPRRILRERRGGFGSRVDYPLYRLRGCVIATFPGSNLRAVAKVVHVRLPAHMTYDEASLFRRALGAALFDENLHYRLRCIGEV